LQTQIAPEIQNRRRTHSRQQKPKKERRTLILFGGSGSVLRTGMA
jgi:hypothetical protein